MQHLRDVRRQIKAVGSIAHLTDAIQKISSIRLSKSKNRFANSKAYTETVNQTLNNLLHSKNDLDNPLCKENTGDSVLVFLLTSDRGLVGAYNENIFHKVLSLVGGITGKKVKIFVVGKKGLRFFQKKDFDVVRNLIEIPVFYDYAFCETITDFIIKEYLGKIYSDIYFVYTSFISMAKTNLVAKKLLPLKLKPDENNDVKDIGLFEPKKSEIIDYLIPEYLKSVVWDGMLQSSASEHASRTLAMEQASKNAADRVENLQLKANKLRQAGITSELTDILGSMEGMV